MHGRPNSIYRVSTPERLKSTLSEVGFKDLQVDISDVAVCLSMAANRPELTEEATEKILVAAASIRQSALQVQLDLPVVVIIDISGADETIDRGFRKDFNRWAADQDWHRGDFAMYICPPVSPYRDEAAGWTMPWQRDELIRHLLGTGPDDWEIPAVERPTVKIVAHQIDSYLADTPEAQSGARGDLLTSVVGALREIDNPRSASAAEDAQGRSAAEGIVDRALTIWEKRNLASPDRVRGVTEGNDD